MTVSFRAPSLPSGSLEGNLVGKHRHDRGDDHHREQVETQHPHHHAERFG